MTRRDLEKVYYLKRELKMWEKRYEELIADMSQDTVAPDGMPYSRTNKVSSPTESKAIQIADHAELIRGKADKIGSSNSPDNLRLIYHRFVKSKFETNETR